jgi:hypothetical protein
LATTYNPVDVQVDPAAIEVAAAALAAASVPSLAAVIPLCFPGKEPGRMAREQKTVTVCGVVLLCHWGQKVPGSPYPGTSVASQMAALAGRARLDGGGGTVGLAVIDGPGSYMALEAAS